MLRLRLGNALKSTLHPQANKVKETTIYAYPTANALAAYVSGSEAPEVTIESLIHKYSGGLDRAISSHPLPTKRTVLLTGSTGNLGSEILARLLQDQSVKTIFTFNRANSSASTAKRHQSQFSDHGLDTNLLSSEKLVLLEGDASKPRLGLRQDEYDLVIDTSVRLHFRCLTICSSNRQSPPSYIMPGGSISTLL